MSRRYPAFLATRLSRSEARDFDRAAKMRGMDRATAMRDAMRRWMSITFHDAAQSRRVRVRVSVAADDVSLTDDSDPVVDID